MKKLLLLAVITLMLGSCHSHPEYVCHCNNSRHADSSTTITIGSPSAIPKDTATVHCSQYSSVYFTDSCYLSVDQIGTPM